MIADDASNRRHKINRFHLMHRPNTTLSIVSLPKTAAAGVVVVVDVTFCYT